MRGRSSDVMGAVIDLQSQKSVANALSENVVDDAPAISSKSAAKMATVAVAARCKRLRPVDSCIILERYYSK